MTTINAQNALQIREKPMEVYINLQTGSTAKITNYSVTGNIKSNDNTLNNTNWTMRPLADLAGGGFLLDGSAEWYNPNTQPSENNGRLGVRGDIGETVTVAITANATLTAVTISSSGAATITHNGTVYPAAGLNVIPINASTATLTFTPEDADTRVEVDYIVPGVIIQVTNDNLISCTLALRDNLNVRDHSFEESEIELQLYYPYDISSSFAYVQDDWPITYQAGYDSDLSDVRKFYLSEPVEMKDNVITLKGVDASHLLDEKTLYEQWYTSYPGNAHQTLLEKFKSVIKSAGVALVNEASISETKSGSIQRAVIPEMSARDFVSGVMNLTMSHYRDTGFGTRYFSIEYRDAGIPTVDYGGAQFAQSWYINKSDCGDWTEVYDRNITKIVNSSDDHKFAETITLSNAPPTYILNNPLQTYEAQSNNELTDISFDTFVLLTILSSYRNYIRNCPSQIVFRHSGGAGQFKICGNKASISGGASAYSNPNGLAGESLEMEPFVYGNITDGTDKIFNYVSLFARSLHSGSFTWKGDPRMQPGDWLCIVDDVDGGLSTWARISGIELKHEAGGTQATINWREWRRPLT